MTAAGLSARLKAPWPPRLLATLGALAIYVAGLWLPVPGVDTGALGATPSLARARLSIFALGVTPLLSAMFLGEIARLAVTRLDRYARDKATEARYGRWLLAVGFAFAAYQGFYVAEAYEGIGGLVPDPGWTFRIGATVAFVGATAFLAAMSSFVTTHGLVDGFWLLFLAPSLESAARKLVLAGEYVRQGIASPASLALEAGFCLLVVLALAYAGGAREKGVQARPPIDNVWTAILGFYVARLLVGALTLLGVGAQLGEALFFVLIVGLVALIGARRGAAWPTLLAQIFALALAEAFALASKSPIPIDAVWLIVATELARNCRATLER